jgi:hypothetical protein
MGKLCSSMHLITLCTPCIASMLASHTYTFAIDHAEQGLEEPPEPAPIEPVNTSRTKPSPGASNRNP